MALVVPAAAFQLAGTQPRPLQRKADSGRTVTGLPRIAVPGSGAARSPTRQRQTQFASVLAHLDDTSWLRPTVHFWTRSAQGCVVLPEGDRRFETQPEDLAWMRAGSA